MDTQVQNIGRGQTWYGKSNTIDTSDYGESVRYEGTERTFRSTIGATPLTDRSDNDVECILVRNVSGATLMPGKAVQWDVGYEGKRIDGYVTVLGQTTAGIIDDHLSVTNGVRNGDLFWLVVKGPCLVYSHKTVATLNATAAGTTAQILIARTANSATGITGNTVGATTNDDGGCLAELTNTNATAGTDGTLARYIKNAVGRALTTGLSNGTIGNTVTPIRLCYINLYGP